MGRQYVSSRPADLKTNNKLSIMRYVYENGTVSKADICSSLGLSKPTTSFLTDELVRADILKVVGVRHSGKTGGKRPQLISFNHTVGLVIALHIGIENIRGSVIDLSGEIYHQIDCPRPESPNELPSPAYTLVNRLILEAEKSRSPILGIGVSIPAIVDLREGRLVSAASLPGWVDVPIKGILESKLGLPIWIDNDSRTIARAEKWFGLGRGVDNFVTITTRLGIGTGIVINGLPLRGMDSSAGELGHTTVDMNGPLCACGNRGCWELFASEPSFLNSVAELSLRTPESQLATMVKSGQPLTMSLIADCQLRGDRFACEQIDRYAYQLGMGIVNIVNVFNPETVILSGNLHHLGEQFLGKLQDQVEHAALAPSSKRVKIRYSPLRGQAELLGAASMIISKALEGSLLAIEG